MNGTANVSNCSKPLNSAEARIGVIFAYCVIFVVSAIANCSIALIVYKIKTMRKPINLFILNMAMSDLLFLISAGTEILFLLKPNSWIFRGSAGDALCKIKDLLVSCSFAVSVQSLVLIAVDRFEAVVFPLRTPIMKRNRCLLFIFSTWILASAVYLPKCLAVRLVKYSQTPRCELQRSKVFGGELSHSTFLVATFVAFFYCPLFVISVLYAIISYKLKTQETPGEHSAQVHQERLRRNKKVFKMSIAIVVGFVLCWIPWSIFDLLQEFHVNIPCSIFFLSITDGIMLLSSSAVNPCICFLFSSNYRKALKKIHFAKCCREVTGE